MQHATQCLSVVNNVLNLHTLFIFITAFMTRAGADLISVSGVRTSTAGYCKQLAKSGTVAKLCNIAWRRQRLPEAA